jgi:ArsR family transcriptional regulator
MPKISKDKLSLKLRAIADLHRREILRMLGERGQCSIDKPVGMCATDVEARLGISQPTVSHHLRILSTAGLVTSQKVGQWVWFQRNEKEVRAFGRELKNL